MTNRAVCLCYKGLSKQLVVGKSSEEERKTLEGEPQVNSVKRTCRRADSIMLGFKKKMSEKLPSELTADCLSCW